MSGARVYRFRSEEDPSVPPDPEICEAAPFAPNVRLGAVLWEEGGDGAPRRLGTATACLQVTDPAFPPGSRVPFYAVFHLPESVVTASGDGTIVTNDVPVPGLVLAVCHLRVTDAPKGFSGGVAASLSVFNPAGLAGFATGSHWTVQLF